MNLKDNIKNFLYDQEYFVSLYKNYIHIYNFEKIQKFNNEEMIFQFVDFVLIVKGEKLLIKKMLKNEVLIKGTIKSLNYNHE